jgi:beta-glucosidase
MAVDGDTATVTVRNTGERAGREVVQVYASRPDSVVERAPRWLVGSAVVEVAAGEVVSASVALGDHNFRHWDGAAHAWMTEPGAYQLYAGRSVSDLPLSAEILRG